MIITTSSSTHITTNSCAYNIFIAPAICGERDYQCATGLCVGEEHLCDGDVDCPHGDDETAGNCQKHKIGWEIGLEPAYDLEEILDYYELDCTYPAWAKCDGVVFCREDEADERNCWC